MVTVPGFWKLGTVTYFLCMHHRLHPLKPLFIGRQTMLRTDISALEIFKNGDCPRFLEIRDSHLFPVGLLKMEIGR